MSKNKGKNNKKNTASTASNDNSPTKNNTQEKDKKSNGKEPEDRTEIINENLSRAEITLLRNKATCFQLHCQWRNHLLRLSYILLFISFYLLRKPVERCLYDIQLYNTGVSSEFANSFPIVFNDTICELLAILMSITLTRCLYELVQKDKRSVAIMSSGTPPPPPPEDTDDSEKNSMYVSDILANNFYILSTLITFPLVYTFFMNRKAMKEHGDNYSCILHLLPNSTGTPTNAAIIMEPSTTVDFEEDDNSLLGANETIAKTNVSTSNRVPIHDFPVIVVFHVITTLVCFFMNFQMNEHEKSLQLVQKLRSQVNRTQALNSASGATKKQTATDEDNNQEKKSMKEKKDD